MFSKISKSFKGSLGNLNFENREESGNQPSYIREYSSSVVSDYNPSSIGRRKSSNKRISRIFSSDVEDGNKSDIYLKNPLNMKSMSMHHLAMNPNKRATVHGSGQRFDSLEAKMIGIQEALARSSSCAEVNSTRPQRISANEANIIMQLRKEVDEKDKMIKKLKEKSSFKIKEFSNSDDEIKYLKNYLSDKIFNINQMKDDLHRKDLKSQTLDNAIDIGELESKIEAYHIDIMNITQKLRHLVARKENQYQNNLNSYLAKHKKVILLSQEILKDDLRQIKLKYGGCGLEILATASDTLAVGDRIVEVNGENVCYNSDRNTWHELRKRLVQPYQVVVMSWDRTQQSQDSGSVPDNNALQDNIALIQTRLSLKLKEGRNVTNVLKNVKEEKDKLHMENTRLNHRISYLEEMCGEMERGMTQARNSLANTLNVDIQKTLLSHNTSPHTVYQKDENILDAKGAIITQKSAKEHHSSSSSGVSCDISSEESNTPQSTIAREKERGDRRSGTETNVTKGKVTNNWIIPPPKPQRQFLTDNHGNLNDYKSDGEALYVSNRIYEKIKSTN